MTDPVTTNYGLTLPTQGGDSDVWGTLQNNGIFTPIDNILGANTTVSITSADVTLTTTQFQNALFIVNGTLTANQALILPFANNGTSMSTTTCVGGKFIVKNNGTGAFNLTVMTATTGTGVTVPQGGQAELYSDGVNVDYVNRGVPGYALASNGNPNGALAGTSGSVNTNPSLAVDYTTNNFWICTQSGTAIGTTVGTAVWQQPNFTILRGFDTAINLSFTTAVSNNSLTVTAVAANTGTTPTAANPIIFPFRDTTLANGDPVTVNATGSLSIQIYSGASLGATNGVPFRFWIVGLNNAGSPVLGLINCSNGTNIFAPNEAALVSSTGMSAGATAATVFYSPNGISLTSVPFRYLGFLSYESGLVTAGTYNNPPTNVQLFGPGIKKPADVVHSKAALQTTRQVSTSGAVTLLNTNVQITPTSAVNQFLVQSNGGFVVNSGGAAVGGVFQLARNATTNLFGSTSPFYLLNNSGSVASCVGVDLPGTTSAITYYMTVIESAGVGNNLFWNNNNTDGNLGAASQSIIIVQEIMG